MQKNKSLSEVLSSPGHLISLAGRGFARLSEARLKPLGFGVGHLPVLVALEEGKIKSQSDLAKFARVEQPSMAQMLNRMERDGLVRRSPDPNDARSSEISLTKLARTRMPGACIKLFEGNRDALKGFSAKEAMQLVDFLQRLIANLDEIASSED